MLKSVESLSKKKKATAIIKGNKRFSIKANCKSWIGQHSKMKAEK